MKPTSMRMFLMGWIVSVGSTELLLAQATPAGNATTNSLAKYDKNNNGTLDADELAAMQADEGRAARAVVGGTDRPGAREETITMSPFEVDASSQSGYYASNTMAGTRLNSKIEDLAASITVVTKEQMADFAMLDINDIFNYEASTEGTGNYTDFSVSSLGVPNDNTMLDPNNANRIRGIGSANISEGNFETSGRVPVDPIGIDAVEISRGPNSSIFGLGTPSGTVNMVPSSANLSRNKSEIQFRGDSFGGQRMSLDLNRVVKRGTLAVRGSVVRQHDGFDRKPSGTDSMRLNGMVKFQPFRSTVISASYSHYFLDGNRPNSTMPRDGITPWLAAGSPAWDPLTRTVAIPGKPSFQVSAGTPPASSGLVSLIQNTGSGSIHKNHLFIDGGRIGFWTPGTGTTLNTPISPDQGAIYYYTQSAHGQFRDTQPLFSTDPSLMGNDIYDWSRFNLAAMNYIRERTNTSRVQIEQFFFSTPRQSLAVQIGWFQEDSRNHDRMYYGWYRDDSASTNYIYIDPNSRLLTGAPNPYFMRPYVGVMANQERDMPMRRNTYRTQLAYKLDLAAQKSWLHLFGLHQVSAYAEYKDFVSRSYPFRDAIVSDHPWTVASVARGSTSSISLPYQNYYHFYLGDAEGHDVDYGPSSFPLGTYDLTWGNPLTGQKTERAQIGLAPTNAGSGSRRLQRTQGAVLQSYLFRDRIVTTFGLRRDENYNRSLTTANDWSFNQGRTRTVGVVLKPLSWLSVHGNKGESFLPANLAQNLRGKIVPDPTGQGNDYGFTLILFKGGLNIRANQYTTKQINSRNGFSTSVASPLRTLDIWDNATRAMGLNVQARRWVTNTFAKRGIVPTEDQLYARVAEVMQLSVERLKMMERMQSGGGDTGLSQIPVAEPSDLYAKGKEIEINYNPTNFWTMKLNVTEQQTIDGKLAPEIDNYIAERLPVWKSIIDEDTGLPWYTTRYGTTSTTASTYLNNTILPRLGIAKATENKSRPQIRKYRANFSQNFRLAGITEHRIVRRFNFGGAARWEDKGAIGYYGVEKLPAIITALDPTRPVWSKPNLYVDLFAGYRAKLFSEKVGMTLQLNVRNVQESGHLQAVSAFPDGTPNALRIIDPRQFILTATFDL